ncbi:methylated-DNA--[protein]-cysteine S-methyltransferase [Woeseiaceae bacterium]|nr:methylated-DNA--[protein]-cysteine S-methyltransferase [Woeseiaceae bacterium]
MDSIMGQLLLAGDEKRLSLIDFPDKNGTHQPDAGWLWSDKYFSEAIFQLKLYFDGKLKKFSIPTHLSGTKFQIDVVKELENIPYGQTCSYADIANKIGHPKAYRAVGSANGNNSLPIIYPCHRVIASNGGLGGYSGGLQLKSTLLELEARN